MRNTATKGIQNIKPYLTSRFIGPFWGFTEPCLTLSVNLLCAVLFLTLTAKSLLSFHAIF